MIGSRSSDVLHLMGSPDDEFITRTGITRWSYKFSSIDFKNGRVTSYSNDSHNLAVRDKNEVQPKTLTVGNGALFRPHGISASLIAPSQTAVQSGGYTNPNTRQVSGHYRANGTYVAPYTQTSPNSSATDNFSSPGNRNSNRQNRSSR